MRAPLQSRRRRTTSLFISPDTGSTATGFLLALVLLVAVGIAAFFYFGGKADVKIKEPNVKVTTTSNQ
jgi:hypothetical protein